MMIYVGEITRRRHVAPEYRTPMYSFATWWYGFGVALGGFALFNILALLGIDEPALNLSVVLTQGLAGALALTGLGFYMAFLYWGRRVPLWPFALFATFFFAMHIYRSVSVAPFTIEVGRWQALPAAADPVREAAFRSVSHAVAFPLLIIILLYGSLFFRSHDKLVRYRIGLVTGAFLLMASVVLIGGVAAPDAWRAALYQGGAFLAALLVLVAYQPPPWIRRLLDGKTEGGVAA